ncbi:MAG TPA: acyltransferase [Burkholderiales bacterium]|nr:acyltransferase [Burkholderiales bacterium]
MERFVALDSWRGIAACLVALFHLEAYSHLVYSHLHGVPFLNNSWLFVDFFFVLSGFVIAANYQQRLLDGFGAGRFLLLRLGRLYPLHVTMLAAAVAVKLLLVLVPALSPGAQAGPAPFSAPQEAPGTIFANLLLVHSLHLYDFFTWNGPSWSISTEFWTYAIFAACLVGLGRHAWVALPVAMIGGPVLVAALSEQNMATEYDWGIVRCVYGFAAGVVTWNLYRRWHVKLGRWLSGSVAEWGAIGLMFAFVSASGTTLLSVAAPYVFGLVVLVFAFEAGTASAILRLRPLVLLGTLSYSVYMTHYFIARRMFDAGRVLEKWWHVDPFTRREIDGQVVEVLGTRLWHGDIAYPVFLATVIAVSWFTYRWIEKPGREWARNRARMRQRSAAPRGVGSAARAPGLP